MRPLTYSLSAFLPLLPLAVARAADSPPMPEGLWDVHTVSTGNPGNNKEEHKYQPCRDHTYDKDAMELAKKIPVVKCKPRRILTEH